MPAVFFLAWAGLLTLLLAMALGTPGRGSLRRPAWAPQLAASLLVIALLSTTLLHAGDDPRPSLEAWHLRVGAGDTPAVLGTDARCDVVLIDPHGDAVHAQVTFPEDGPRIQNLSRDRRVLRDGQEIHHLPLAAGDELSLGDRIWTVDGAGAVWPSVSLAGPDGEQLKLRPRLLRRLAGAWPGSRLESTVGWLDAGRGGLTTRRPTMPDGARAEIALRGRTPVLRFPTSADRATHPVRVRATGGAAVRPADRSAGLRSGDELTLGYTRYRVERGPDDSLSLEVQGAPPRRTFDPDDGILVVGPGGDLPWSTGAPVHLQIRRGEAPGDLWLISTDPEWVLSRRQGYLWLHPRGTSDRPDEPVLLQRGSGLILSGPRHEAVYRYRAGITAASALAGDEPGTPETRFWQATATAAALYLLLALLLTRASVLHPRNAAMLHGAVLLAGLGLAVLLELSPPGDPRRADLAARQAAFCAAGLAAGVVAATAWLAAMRLRRREARPGRWLRFLEGPLGGRRWGHLRPLSLSRVSLLWGLAAVGLAVQLPFGERGLPVPLLGAVQPVEAAKTLLMVYVAFLGVRALEDKRARLAGPEGLLRRWSTMLHAVPIMAIALLCYGLDDLSPVLILGLFLWTMYLLSLVSPSRRFWPPRHWLHNVYIEQLALVALAVAGVWLAARFGGGTVTERFAAWSDPWHRTAASSQFVSSLWMVMDGGALGRGFGAPLPELPPAAHDDFVLSVLANRTGLTGLLLVACTAGTMVTAGFAAVRAVGPRTRPDLAGLGWTERARMLGVSALVMLTLQSAVVFASVTGWAPVMGQPMPFVAAGGSHLLLMGVPLVALLLASTRLQPTDAVAVAVAAEKERRRDERAA